MSDKFLKNNLKVNCLRENFDKNKSLGKNQNNLLYESDNADYIYDPYFYDSKRSKQDKNRLIMKRDDKNFFIKESGNMQSFKISNEKLYAKNNNPLYIEDIKMCGAPIYSKIVGFIHSIKKYSFQITNFYFNKKIYKDPDVLIEPNIYLIEVRRFANDGLIMTSIRRISIYEELFFYGELKFLGIV